MRFAGDARKDKELLETRRDNSRFFLIRCILASLNWLKKRSSRNIWGEKFTSNILRIAVKEEKTGGSARFIIVKILYHYLPHPTVDHEIVIFPEMRRSNDPSFAF